jgi:O-antigen/teichoic acid export membrane protein
MMGGLRNLTTTVKAALHASDSWPFVTMVSGASVHALASLAVLVVAAWVFPQSDVGVIALVVALQFILSQGFTVGINLAVLYRVSDIARPPVSPLHGFINVLVVSVLLALAFLLAFRQWGTMLFPAGLVEMVWQLTAYAVLSASVKVFLADLNARRSFKQMGMLLAMRGLVAAGAMTAAILTEMSLTTFVWLVMVLPEAAAFAVHAVYALAHPVRFDVGRAVSIFRADLRFGTKAIAGTMLLESAIKADVLMMGMLTDARTTGLYALVSVTSDLFIQCMVFARVFLNPRYTEAYSASGAEGVLRLAGRVLRWSYPLGALAASLLVGGSLLAVHAIPAFMAYREAMPAVLVLWVFLCLTAGFFPLFQLLGQVGRPLHQSATYTALFMANVLFNALLIPHWGATGAALATGLAYVVHAAFLAIILRSMSTSSTPIA